MERPPARLSKDVENPTLAFSLPTLLNPQTYTANRLRRLQILKR